MSFNFSIRSRFDNITVKNITSANIQQNKVTQTSDQFGSARARLGLALAKNTADQNAPSSQRGSAFNNINIRTRARVSDILVKNIDSTNAQSNDVFQDNKQKAVSTTWGIDPAINNSWQKASNYQAGSAFNNININA